MYLPQVYMAFTLLLSPPADPKDLECDRPRSRLGKQQSLLLRQVSLRDDTVSEPNLSSETVNNAGGVSGGNGSLRSIAAAKLLRKSGFCEPCVQVASISGQIAFG